MRRAVRHQDDRHTLPSQLEQVIEAPALELLVTDRDDLVDHQDVGLHVHRDRETEPHVHAARVVLDRRVDEVFEPGELDDVVDDRVDLASRQPEDRAVEVDVLAAGQLGVEAGAELEQRRDAAVGVTCPTSADGCRPSAAAASTCRNRCVRSGRTSSPSGSSARRRGAPRSPRIARGDRGAS